MSFQGEKIDIVESVGWLGIAHNYFRRTQSLEECLKINVASKVGFTADVLLVEKLVCK